MHDNLIRFVQDKYTESGVSVLSRGMFSITLELPADFPDATGLVLDLHTQYGACCDLSTVNRTAVLTVWVPDARTMFVSSESPLNVRCSVMATVMSALVVFGGIFFLYATGRI